MKLSNRTIVITGGTSGIGLAFALKLLSLGNKVIVIGRNQATLDQATTKHKGLIGLQGDVSNANSVREMAAFLRDRYPEASILFNSAGIMRAFELMDDNLDLERTTAEVDTNLNGTIWMTEALLPQLAQQDEAMIVTVSSGLSYVTSPIHPVYSATKAGVHMFTDALRIQLKKSGKNIHVMELVPPLVAETNLESDSQSGGRAPNMSLDTLVNHGIRGMERNKKRVVPGFSKFLRFAGKYFPDALSNAMARG
ncbi:SDR family oxidoreductase [Cohnella algarum]|uniref:SDR family oxidoreductase n=1 Tax=Cohnella algarum TaxID=2044859 RepID=UPI001967648E|nr:SDR family NAD(P)-dependent oxidoreductase [Cohnella algarum]MBN2981086.1 SDR family NAD(P)-dependent oxidoreductase [Cohnella algarum]